MNKNVNNEIFRSQNIISRQICKFDVLTPKNTFCYQQDIAKIPK